VIIDRNDIRIGFEYKPSGESNREYIGGLGQALSYLQRDHYSYLIVPQSWGQLDFLTDHLSSDIYRETPIGLISVEIKGSSLGSISVLRTPPQRRTSPKRLPRARRSFVFWRDLSPHEIHILLYLSSSLMFSNPQGSIEKKLWESFFDDYFWPSSGPSKCKDFDGVPRNPGRKGGNRGKFKKSQKINYLTPLKHLGLVDPECRLTEMGAKLLSIGLTFGPFDVFQDFLTARILREGGFLELIFDIRDYQEKHSVPKKANDFSSCLYRHLERNGKVFSGRTRRYTTGAKPRFRDEAKLMNKLGLLIKKSSHQYFFPKEGFKFHFDRIISILDEFP